MAYHRAGTRFVPNALETAVPPMVKANSTVPARHETPEADGVLSSVPRLLPVA